MCALPPKADIHEHDQHVRFVPIADIVPQKKVRLAAAFAAAASIPDDHNPVTLAVASYRACHGLASRQSHVGRMAR